MKDWHRTLLLILLLVAALALSFWTKQEYSSNFLDAL